MYQKPRGAPTLSWYQCRFSRVSGMYQECISLTEDACLIRVSGVYQLSKDAWKACVSEVYQECISSLEGHLPRPGISVGLAMYQACIRSVSASPRTRA